MRADPQCLLQEAREIAWVRSGGSEGAVWRGGIADEQPAKSVTNAVVVVPKMPPTTRSC